jgi:hypothetical protein
MVAIFPPLRQAQSPGLKNFAEPVQFSAYVADDCVIGILVSLDGCSKDKEGLLDSTTLGRIESKCHGGGVHHYTKKYLRCTQFGFIGKSEARFGEHGFHSLDGFDGGVAMWSCRQPIVNHVGGLDSHGTKPSLELCRPSGAEVWT